MILFENPIRAKKVRFGVVAYQYRSGIVEIDGRKYSMYSMSGAIKQFRKDFPLNKGTK